MKVCKKETKDKSGRPELIPGHLYQATSSSVVYGIYLCTVVDGKDTLHSVHNGGMWSHDGFGRSKGVIWEDVTHKYCLTEVD